MKFTLFSFPTIMSSTVVLTVLLLISSSVLQVASVTPGSFLAKRQSLVLDDAPQCDEVNNLANDGDCRTLVNNLVAAPNNGLKIILGQPACVGTCCIRFSTTSGSEDDIDSFPNGIQLREAADKILAFCPTGEVQDQAKVSGKLSDVFLGRQLGRVCLSSAVAPCTP